MATVRIMYWHDIPYQVKVQDDAGIVKKQLPARFSQAINSASIARQKHENNAYMNGWKWSKKETKEGSAEHLAQNLVNELDKDYPKEKLRDLLLGHAKKPV